MVKILISRNILLVVNISYGAYLYQRKVQSICIHSKYFLEKVIPCDIHHEYVYVFIHEYNLELKNFPNNSKQVILLEKEDRDRHTIKFCLFIASEVLNNFGP